MSLYEKRPDKEIKFDVHNCVCGNECDVITSGFSNGESCTATAIIECSNCKLRMAEHTDNNGWPHLPDYRTKRQLADLVVTRWNTVM